MTTANLPIVNNHVHFVIEIPDAFPNKVISKMANTKVGFAILSGILKNAIPFTDKDDLSKLLDFIKASRIGSWADMYNDILQDGGYSPRTKFVVLTVNMAYMGAGKVKKNMEQSCAELEALRLQFPDTIIPFFHADYRDASMNMLFDRYVKNGAWGGVKMYNSMGTKPQSDDYDYIYSESVKLNKPIIAHCTYGNPIHFKGSDKQLAELLGDWYDPKASRKDNCNKFTNPLNWEEVAKKYPELRIDLAHFGGSDNWRKWWVAPFDQTNVVNVILGVMQRCPNVFADISFTLNDESLYPLFNKLMTRDEYSFIRDRVLFGSDYWMNKSECTERQWADNFEFSMGKEVFDKIARENTHRFLGLTS